MLTNRLVLAIVTVGGDSYAASAEAGDGHTNTHTTTHTLADRTSISTSFMVLTSLCGLIRWSNSVMQKALKKIINKKTSDMFRTSIVIRFG